MRILVTRPRPDAKAQADTLAALGHDPVIEPLLDIAFPDPGPLPLGGAQALIATSRNGVRALAAMGGVAAAAHLPLYAVGAATARLAREAGFARVHEGGGTAEALAATVAGACSPDGGHLVHLAGERLAFDLKGALEREGFTVEQPVMYRAAAREAFSAGVREEIASGALGGVILMSPRTAKTYMDLAGKAGLAEAAARLVHFCLSPAVAAELEGLGAARVAVADAPSRDGLLALIAHETANSA